MLLLNADVHSFMCYRKVMEYKLSIVWLLLVTFTACSAQNTYYVIPSLDTSCPGEPCHTLSQYAADQYFLNLPSNTTMEFLPGNHTLEQTISVTNLTWLTLHGDPSSLPEVTSRIVCTWPAGFVFTGIMELYITALDFISCGHNGSAAVSIMDVQQSNISNCSFQNNVNAESYDYAFRFDYRNRKYNLHGGALYMQNSFVILTTNRFQHNFAEAGGAFYIELSNSSITYNMFEYNSAAYGGALLVQRSSAVSLTENTFQYNSARWGGALYSGLSTLNLTRTTFLDNFAEDSGGALDVLLSTLILTWNTFHNNSARSGGAIYIQDFSTLNATSCAFWNNSAHHRGGALIVYYSTLNLTRNVFQNMYAANFGGALDVYKSVLSLTENIFQNNSASYGGSLSINRSSTLSLTVNAFQYNWAEYGGVINVAPSSIVYLTGNTFQNNSAFLGGVILANNNGTVRMYERNILGNNAAQYGGGIAALDSQLEFERTSIITNNTASYGGGIYVHNVNISGNMTLTKNSAAEGGGIYASRSTFYFARNSTIRSNSAVDGGGMLLSESTVYLQPNTQVYFISNSAKRTGGAIKVEEHNPLTYCIHSRDTSYNMGTSDCFFQIQNLKKYNYKPSEIKKMIDGLKVQLSFVNNTAVEAGADLHGGSVDKCILKNYTVMESNECLHCPDSGDVFDVITSSEKCNTPNVSSDPLFICTCRDNLTECSGLYRHPQAVYPGGTLEVPVIARGQRNGTTAAVILATNTPKGGITISDLEKSQNIINTCSLLKYTIQSNAVGTTQVMTLTAVSPCSPTVSITVDIQNCPTGFQLSETDSTCVCAERLQQFTTTCIVDNVTVLRVRDARFWVGYSNDSRGLILHPNCPFDYCTSKEVYLAVDDSDEQCNYNRSGLLCGRCHENYSLSLGSSRCLQCSNSYLSLLVAFAFAGIALVLLLLALRLTVVAGTINGLIFYANVIAVNSAIFFQPQPSNVLTVFIAWLNLDLGIETCFYSGMDDYVKAWLQFTFPLYLWALVGMIIIGSYYSGRVARVFGNNPVAVLATLFLLSYAKLLRTVIAALSYTFLEYPNSSLIAVWLYDGNVRYLSGKHIPLFTAAMACLIFLFLPYTTLLIFGQWLQARSNLKIFFWINSPKIKPFLDAYHAPYSNKHRYWTGLMLLLRFVLFLISAVNALGDPNVNLLAIASTMTLTLPIILGTRIYKTWSLGLLETSFIINLIILTVATFYIRLTAGHQNAATFTSVGIAFATFTGIAIYHSVQQIKGTRLWRRVCLRHDYVRVPLTDVDSGPEDPPDSVFVSGSAPTQTVVDIRDCELREPCMATD